MTDNPRPTQSFADELNKILLELVVKTRLNTAEKLGATIDTFEMVKRGMEDKSDMQSRILAALDRAITDGKPKRYTLQTGLLWDSQDASDGYHQGVDDTSQGIRRRILGEGK